MIKSFVENFIKDIYKERILFELSSNKPNKREKAILKFIEKQILRKSVLNT